jgi:hypothetical protein
MARYVLARAGALAAVNRLIRQAALNDPRPVKREAEEEWSR